MLAIAAENLDQSSVDNLSFEVSALEGYEQACESLDAVLAYLLKNPEGFTRC